MGGLQIGARGVRIEVVDERVQAVLRVSAVGAVDVAGGRTAEDVADEHHLRAAFRRSRPFDLAGEDGQHIRGSFLGRGARRSPGLGEGERAQGIGRRGQGDGLPRRHTDSRIGDDALHGELRIILADLAAGEAAGVVALVRQPHLHAALARLFHGELHEREMLGRKVLGRHAARGGEVDDVDSVGDQLVELPHDARLGQFVAPDGPVDGAVFARRRAEIGGRLADRGNRDLLPRPLRRQSQRQQERNQKARLSIHLRKRGLCGKERPGGPPHCRGCSLRGNCPRRSAPRPE